MASSGQTSSPDPLAFRTRMSARELRRVPHKMSARVRTQFTLTLPGSRSRAIWTLGLFIAVQFADAVLTVTGISRFGPAVEANPLLSFCATAFGVGAALVGAKTVAIVGGATLHVLSQHFILAALTVACVFAAIVPWAMVLSW
jgi:hypothetical protein